MLNVLGPDGINRSVDEHYDTMMDVDQDPTGAMQAIHSQAREIERLRSVIKNQNETLAPFAFALKFARERLGEMPDINDTTALASRWITYESLKDALGVYNQYKEQSE